MSGHGWVIPNKDGSVARCGGPAICSECQRELQLKNALGSLPIGDSFLDIQCELMRALTEWKDAGGEASAVTYWIGKMIEAQSRYSR